MDVLEILNEHQALILEDHFVYASGRHGSKYINKDALFPHVEDVKKVGHQLFFKPYRDKLYDVDDNDEAPQVIIGPVVGGAILAQWATLNDTAFRLKILAAYADKENILDVDQKVIGYKFVIKRGYDKIVKGKRVLIVEDILTTGGSVKKVVKAVKNVGGIPIGVSAIVNRGGVTAEDLDVPWLCSLVSVNFESYTEEECKDHGPCSKDVPINTELGRGKEYLAKLG